MINKEKILAGVRACVNPIGALCKNCPYWDNGDKQCEELRMDIVEAIDSGVFAPQHSPKTAKWMPIEKLVPDWGANIIHHYECSNCQTLEYTNDRKYCSNCGQKWRSNNMKFTVIAYAESGLPRKEVIITTRDKDEAWSKAWRMFPEYHEVGVFEEDK